jgi:glycosyltransferase involved in cell wall biosynthesis
MIPFFLGYLRNWDITSNSRVDEFIANSKHVQKRIWRYYRRNSQVIYPPVNTQDSGLSTKDEGYYLLVSAFAPYKRIDLAITAFNEIGERLVIVGSGQDERRLKKMARAHIEFVGWVHDQQLRQYYAGCRALIFPGLEDFGIVPLEAQCFGKPVVAYGAGGVLETVKGLWETNEYTKEDPPYTGVFFSEQTVEHLKAAVFKSKAVDFDPQFIRHFALNFDKKMFKEKIKLFIEKRLSQKNSFKNEAKSPKE